ncbi:hypothetical protein KI387_009569, partial [Taxus chinensis]
HYNPLTIPRTRGGEGEVEGEGEGEAAAMESMTLLRSFTISVSVSGRAFARNRRLFSTRAARSVYGEKNPKQSGSDIRRAVTYSQLGLLAGGDRAGAKRILSSSRRPFSLSTRASLVTPPQPPPLEANPDVVSELGFEKVEEQFLNEYKSTAILYRHKRTGAEVMSVSNDDENKVFGIVIRTPP